MADSPPPPAPSSKAIVFARRSASTLFLWALVTSIFISRNSWAFLCLIGLLALIATMEYFRMLRLAKVPCFPRFGVFTSLAYSGALYAPLLAGCQPWPYIDSLAVFMVVTGGFMLQLRHPIRGLESLAAVAFNLVGFVYITFLFNFAAQLIFLPDTCPAVPGLVCDQGAFLILWLLAVTKFTDMGAYITGSLIGRNKMIPHVSPAKTWEGFAGALLFAQIAACGLFACFPHHLSTLGHWGHVVTLGFLLAVLAVIGDLAESVVKRALDAKDSGRMLPGIGGSLDLIDSLCLTAPALFFYLKWLQPAIP